MILSGQNHFGSNFAHNHSHGYKTWNHHENKRRKQPQQPADSASSRETNVSATKQQAFGSLRRQPAPRQPAPERPNSLMACLMNEPAQEPPQPPARRPVEPTPASEYSSSKRASTLNRLDVLKRRQQQQQPANATPRNPTTLALRRNLSSLGHYPATRSIDRYDSASHQRQRPPAESIYAPASIASPREFNHNYYSYSTLLKQPPNGPNGNAPDFNHEQHYASASVSNQCQDHSVRQRQMRPVGGAELSQTRHEITSSPAAASQRPGSSLGQLLERFGSTLRRKVRRQFARAGGSSWSTSSQRRSQTPHSQIYAPASAVGFPAAISSRHHHQTAGSVSSYGSPRTRSSSRAPDSGYASTPPLPPGKPLVLDPELYASGKRQVKADEIYAEGSRALDCNAERRLLEHQLLDPELMAEGETCTIIDEQSSQQADYQLLVRQLTNWLNDELAGERIVVRDLQDDVYDGQVLCKLIEKFHNNCKLDIVEVTQNERLQRRKLSLALEVINRTLAATAAAGPQSARPQIRWSVEGIHGKNVVEILHLLAAMALLYKAPVRLPANVVVRVLVFQKHQNELVSRSHQVQLTGGESVALRPTGAMGPRSTDPATTRRDAFDLLLECAPDKLHIVKRSLARFCNRHLNRINMSCGSNDDLEPEHFSDGLLLVFLISSLEDFFVPLGNLFTTTTRTRAADKLDETLPFIDANNNNVVADATYEAIGRATALEPASFTCSQPIERLHNVNVALQLIEEAGLVDIRQRVRPEEIVNGDMKALLRVLYALFGCYKHL